MLKSFLVLIFLAAALPAHAQSIAVVVNGQAISDLDVVQRQRLLSLGKAEGRSGAVEELINETLKNQEAKKLKITVTDAQVNAAFEQIAKHSNMSSDAFARALQSRGVEAKTLQDRLRAEIAWQSVIRMKAHLAMNVRDEDVIEALKKKGKDPDAIKSYEYSLMQAMVFTPKGLSAAMIADRRRKAEAFRSTLKGCDTAKQRALTFTDTAVHEPIQKSGNEISGPVAELLEKTPVGSTTPIQATENGFEFMIICDKKPISGTEGAKAQMRNELMVKEVARASERLMSESRQKANIEYRKK